MTLYGSNGRPMYAISSAHGPRRATGRHGLGAVRRHGLEFALAEDGPRVLRTYVPIAGVDGNVAESSDSTRRSHRVQQRRVARCSSQASWSAPLLLFVALVPVLARASSRIDAHSAELEYVATHDELTGMPNRYGFKRAAEEVLRTHDSAAIMLVDLDGFSEINGSLGSEGGDRLLIEVGERLVHELAPDHALVARLGEDEFGVLHGATDVASAEWVAQRIRRSIARPFAIRRRGSRCRRRLACFPGTGGGRDPARSCSDCTHGREGEGRSGVQVYDASHSAHDSRRPLGRGRSPATHWRQTIARLLPATD